MSDLIHNLDQVPETQAKPSNFIDDFIKEDISQDGQFAGQTVHTRFPPEPNGYLHIGHAKAICIDFGTAEKFGGKCNLRMDDTNPTKEDTTFVNAIQEDIKWLGFDWEDRFYHASDYFDQMYDYAVELIKKGLAFVCDMNADEMRATRGTLTQAGTESPYRNRSVEENLKLFAQMKNGDFADGTHTLRAKINMASGNMNMRDPVLYRILHQHHHRAGDKWCIYPMYDFAQPLEDAIEGVTHSLCSLEFEDHRPLYDWVLQNTSTPCKPRQIEFARLGINCTVMSKRKLRYLVENNVVDGWDDPRLPTLGGLRRRGFTPASIRNFCERIGVAKVNSIVEYGFLEHCVREDLNDKAPRKMAVIDPLRLVIENYPEGHGELVNVENHASHPEMGTREIPFGRELYVERDDFMVEPPKKYFRLFVGNEVRLKGAYFVKVTHYDTDDAGNVKTVYATYDPASKGGNSPDGRKVKGTIHWVDKATAIPATVKLYSHLFTVTNPDDGDADYLSVLNPDSVITCPNALLEPSLVEREATAYQFLRLGYFARDPHDDNGKPVFNRTVGLKDSYQP